MKDGRIFYHIDVHLCAFFTHLVMHMDVFLQDCSNFIANTLELLQPCFKPSICASKQDKGLLAAQPEPL